MHRLYSRSRQTPNTSCIFKFSNYCGVAITEERNKKQKLAPIKSDSDRKYFMCERSHYISQSISIYKMQNRKTRFSYIHNNNNNIYNFIFSVLYVRMEGAFFFFRSQSMLSSVNTEHAQHTGIGNKPIIVSI